MSTKLLGLTTTIVHHDAVETLTSFRPTSPPLIHDRQQWHVLQSTRVDFGRNSKIL